MCKSPMRKLIGSFSDLYVGMEAVCLGCTHPIFLSAYSHITITGFNGSWVEVICKDGIERRLLRNILVGNGSAKFVDMRNLTEKERMIYNISGKLPKWCKY